MAKYGSFKYSTAKYGTGVAGAQPTHTGAYLWTLLIGWGTNFVNEAARCVNVKGNRGRKFYVGQGANTFEPVQPGQFYFTLDNFDGRYDPYNSSSPLYGYILPGRVVHFRVMISANVHQYVIFTGRIRDIRPISGVNQVEILVVDTLQWLADQDITIPVAYNIKVDAAIRHTLDAAQYPYPVSLGASTCPITYFDPDEANALDTIRALTDAGIGTAFVDVYGKFNYYDLTKTGITTHSLDQAVLLKEIAVTQPWETVRNKITCIANRYGYGPLEVIWRLDEPVYIAANGSVTFKIEFEAAAVIQPVPGVDYDESTILYNGRQFGIFPTIRVALSNITSTGATVTIVNSNSAGTYMNFLAIRGNKLVNKKVTFVSVDNASISDYGPRRFRIDSPWLQDRGFAEAYATLLKNFLKTPSKSPVIELETREDGLGIELFDWVTLTSAKLGLNNTFDVGAIDFQWLEPTGQAFKQTIYLQNILYSTATITPQPYYPGQPPVPPVTPPMPPIPPPGNGGGTVTENCLSPTKAEAENGPWDWGPMVIDNLHERTTLGVNKWFRSIYHPHRTRIEIDGLWETQVGGIWSPDATLDFEYMTAYNDSGVDVAHGAISGPKVADGVRTYLFDNVNPYWVSMLALSLGQSVDSPFGGAIGDPTIIATPGEYNTITVTGSTITKTGGGGSAVVINGVVDFIAHVREDVAANMAETRFGAEFTAPWIYPFAGDFRCTIAGDYSSLTPHSWFINWGTNYGAPTNEYLTFGPLPDNALIIVDSFGHSPGNNVFQIRFTSYAYTTPHGDVTGHAYFTFTISGTGAVIPTKRVTIRSIKLFNVCS